VSTSGASTFSNNLHWNDRDRDKRWNPYYYAGELVVYFRVHPWRASTRV
jgi:hypothetical protein